jgi:SAM-dependent methyltransferase
MSKKEPPSKNFIHAQMLDTILLQARQAYRRKGLYYIIRIGIKMALDLPKVYFWLWYYKTFKSSETFEFQGNTYRYLFHPYCTSWKNERAIVIPIIWDIVKRNKEQKKRILEVGNVLSYVFYVNHDVLDKYEIKDGIINEDVVDFNPSNQYDLIVSIFTLHLVGWYETPRNPVKSLRAIENLKRILAAGGQMIVVHPLGQNQEMDDLLKKGVLQFNSQYFFKRISNYKWIQVQWEDIKDVKYDDSIPTANGLVIGIFEKK